ncbi:HAMP domain-containing protein, partial [Stenotrophomonas sp. SrG]|uniref:HAMP domain-containing protein n=1 Tax=Stenotrophomonas sp. SrG TaxID=3414430 RepID=UPI003CFAD8E6
SPAIAHTGSLAVSPLCVPVRVRAFGVRAYVVARFASAPLQRLASAAADRGGGLQRAPVPVTGPRVVRRAAVGFNAMRK